MFYDEDGDLAHEFYEETIITKNGQKRSELKQTLEKKIANRSISITMHKTQVHVDQRPQHTASYTEHDRRKSRKYS
ncbi:hypothetical protein STEG23_026380 [Scotinomys teguina]